MTEQELANVIWDIKEVIRNSYDDSEVEAHKVVVVKMSVQEE